MADDRDYDEFVEKTRRLLNLQAAAMLKCQQDPTEIWKIVITAMGLERHY